MLAMTPRALMIVPDKAETSRERRPSPDQEVDQLVLVLLSEINLARRSIRIATPYFLPDKQIITALQLAVLQGDGAAGGRL